MSEHQTKLTPEEQRRRVKLKWDLLANASTDEAVASGNFRFMFRVLQQLDLLTWTCTISDDRVCAELPGCRNRKTAEDHRSAITRAGYWTADSGSGRHATRYFIAEEIPDRAIAGIAAKKLAYQEERANRPKPNRAGVKQPRKSDLSRGQTHSDNGVISPPVQVSSSRMALRREDETQDAHAPAPMPARAVPPPPSDDEWVDEALRLEFEVRELPRSESGDFVCIDCGAGTELAARYKSAPYCPFCANCIAEGQFPDVRRFAAPMSYAEASRGR